MFIGALLQVNAPSIGAGYAFPVLATTLAALILPPGWAALATLAGHLAALPLVAASKSMIFKVALIAALLRPLVAYAASYAARRAGPAAGAVAVAALDSLAAVTAGTLYYGNDGIHTGIAVHDLAPALLAWAALDAWERSRRLAAVAAASAVVYLLGILYFYSHAAPLAALAATGSLAAARRGRDGPLVAGGLLALLAVGVALGWQGLVANTAIAGYPLNPHSYTSSRWTLEQPCAGRSDAMLGVHDPSRLRIAHECATVEGVVDSVPFVADDGDYCINLKVENSTVEPLLGVGNYVLLKGRLHVEVIPRDRGLLNRLGGKVCVGDHLMVTGVHVVDTDHGQWAEIHPALNITLLERGSGPCVALEPGGSSP